MSDTVVSAIQFKPQRGDLDGNRKRLVRLITASARAGAELVVAPEMCTSGYMFADRQAISPSCEPRDGTTAQLFAELARRLEITLVYGWPERVLGRESLYNSAAVMFADREPMFYRKRLLYEADTSWATSGDSDYPVWYTKGGLKASLGICMDLNDPVFRKHLQDSDIRLCAFPTNWLDQGFSVWNYWAWCLAGTQTCLLAANSYGEEDQTVFRGESAILDGRVLLACAEAIGDDIVVARVPPQPTPFLSQDEPS